MKKYTYINKYRMAYTDEGSGTPIIFIHNGGSSGFIWEKQKEFFLSKGFRVIVPDLIGFGTSDIPTEEMTLKLHSKYLSEMLKQLNIGHAHLVGVCIGANVLLSLINKKKVECQHPVLINPFPGSYLIDSKIKRALYTKIGQRVMTSILRLSYQFKINRMLPLKFLFSENFSLDTLSCSDKETIKKNYSQKKYIFSRVSLWKNVPDFTLHKENYTSLLKKRPLIIWGEKNQVTNKKYSKHIKNLFENYDFKVIADSGHLLMIEKPDELNELILRHIQST